MPSNNMKNLTTIKAAIFDMDGLLLDTEIIALNTFVESCRECGFDPDINVYYKCIGTNSVKTKEMLIDGYGDGFPYEKISRIWSAKYQDIIMHEKIPMKPGVVNLLTLFRKSKKKIALATSTEYDIALIKLKNAGIYHYFDFIIGGDQVEKGKPDPEIYFKASERLNELPGNCLVLEDSDNGVLAAFRAGMQIIQVPDLKKPSTDILKIGHLIFDSLNEVYKVFKDHNK